MPVPTTAQNVMPARRSDRQRTGGRAGPGQHAQQVTKQDEEEHIPQERQKLVRVVLADRRPGNLVANEDQHHFKEVPEQPLGRTPAANPLGQAKVKYQEHQRGRDQFQDHELGHLETEHLRKLQMSARGNGNGSESRM